MPENDDRTRDQPVDRLPRYILLLLATVSAFSIGTYLAWSSSALPILNKIDRLAVTKQESSWICASVPLGAIVGSLPARIIADKIGRKKSILLNSLVLSLCWFVIGFARSKLWIFLPRVVAGAACGASSIVVPIYICEIADDSIRESLWTIFQLQIALGVLFAYVTGFSDSFLVIALLCALVPGVLSIATHPIPESPVWLTSKGRRREAAEIAKLFGGGQCLDKEETWRTGTVLELKNHAWATIVALGLLIFQQLSGVYALVSYATTIFEHVGFPLNWTISALIVGLTYVIATLLSTTLVDRIGRKLSLFLGMTIMAICMFVLSGYFSLQKTHDVSSFSWLPFLSISIFFAAYSVGCGSIPWIIVDKIFPNDVKWTAISASVTCNWISATIATKCYHNMVVFMGMSSTFATFGMVSLFGILFVAIFVPETEGKSIEELQNELHDSRRHRVTCI